MAVDFKQKIAELHVKDKAVLTSEEVNYIKIIEDYIDSEINKKLSTDRQEVWIDINYIKFNYNPLTKKMFGEMTNARKKFLQDELLARYERANWKVDYQIDDGRDGNMSGGDYLILKGIR